VRGKTEPSEVFPPWNYTRFANAALEAMMRPGQPVRQRVFACYVRFSWGYGSTFVVKSNGEAATQAWAADKLSISRTHLNNVHLWLVANTWIVLLLQRPSCWSRPFHGCLFSGETGHRSHRTSLPKLPRHFSHQPCRGRLNRASRFF
jgi:hypothetical protein